VRESPRPPGLLLRTTASGTATLGVAPKGDAMGDRRTDRSAGRLLGIACVAGAVLTFSGCTTEPTPGPTSPSVPRVDVGRPWSDVSIVQLLAVPGGPHALAFVRPGTSQSSLPEGTTFRSLTQIARLAPQTVPQPMPQGGCALGGDVVLTLVDGATVTYGPCHRPASIDRLWVGIERVLTSASRDQPCFLRTDPASEPFKGCIDDYGPSREPGLGASESKVAGEIELNLPCAYTPQPCTPAAIGVSALILLHRAVTGEVVARATSPGSLEPTQFVFVVSPGFYYMEVRTIPGERQGVCAKGAIVVASPGQSIYVRIYCVG
jgi:hypothetical protein